MIDVLALLVRESIPRGTRQFPLRIRPQDHRDIKRAAQLCEMSVTQFSVNVLTNVARSINAHAAENPYESITDRLGIVPSDSGEDYDQQPQTDGIILDKRSGVVEQDTQTRTDDGRSPVPSDAGAAGLSGGGSLSRDDPKD